MVKSTETIYAHDNSRLNFNFDNSFARSLEGFFVSCQAEPAVAPKLLQFNHALAEELGVSRQSVNAIETGRYDPSLPLAFRIAELFGMPIEEIFLREEEPRAD